MDFSIPRLACADRFVSSSIAVRHAERSISYGELAQESSQVANGLRALGVKAGDRVAVISRNSIESIEVLLGISKIGGVPVFLNWRLSLQELADLLDDARPVAVFMQQEFSEGLQATLSKLSFPSSALVFDSSELEVSYRHWKDQYESDLELSVERLRMWPHSYIHRVLPEEPKGRC